MQEDIHMAVTSVLSRKGIIERKLMKSNKEEPFQDGNVFQRTSTHLIKHYTNRRQRIFRENVRDDFWEGPELTKDGQESQLKRHEFEHFRQIKGAKALQYSVDFKDQMLLMQAQENESSFWMKNSRLFLQVEQGFTNNVDEYVDESTENEFALNVESHFLKLMNVMHSNSDEMIGPTSQYHVHRPAIHTEDPNLDEARALIRLENIHLRSIS
ncbi:hypothetical protein Tco_0968892 [Tanacetum coccineum]